MLVFVMYEHVCTGAIAVETQGRYFYFSHSAVYSCAQLSTGFPQTCFCLIFLVHHCNAFI